MKWTGWRKGQHLQLQYFTWRGNPSRGISWMALQTLTLKTIFVLNVLTTMCMKVNAPKMSWHHHHFFVGRLDSIWVGGTSTHEGRHRLLPVKLNIMLWRYRHWALQSSLNRTVLNNLWRTIVVITFLEFYLCKPLYNTEEHNLMALT